MGQKHQGLNRLLSFIRPSMACIIKAMDFSYLLSRHKLNSVLLEKAGFCKDNGVYQCRKSFADPNFYAIIRINEELFEVKVYETSFDEEYIPFTLKSVQTPLVAGLREQVNEWVETILETAFDQNDVKSRLIEYGKEKHHSVPEHPFDEEPYQASTVLRVSKGGKWYALFMDVKAKAMGFKDEGEVDVVNLKADPAEMASILDQRHFFPAYHMNKKLWISIVLDETTPWEKTISLLDQSFALVSEKK
jgi:predicted DNA-binding protein (MmcQ/YjbR family)